MGEVNQLLSDFDDGRRDSAGIWINREERKVHIRYCTVRDKAVKYRDTLEASQGITKVQDVKREKGG